MVRAGTGRIPVIFQDAHHHGHLRCDVRYRYFFRVFKRQSVHRSLWDSLFDMDGTLVDSTAGVTAAWEAILEEYPREDLTVEEILSCEPFFMKSFYFRRT